MKEKSPAGKSDSFVLDAETDRFQLKCATCVPERAEL